MTRYVSGDNWQPSDGVELTPEQQTAVLINDRNIAIVAGPGTGKTEVLAQKATYLLQTGLCLSPFRILALCYKVDAASNIRERVKKRCPKDLSSRFCSLTVDSFIISLVRRFATSLPSWLKIQTDFEIVDEIDLVNYCRSANTTVFPNQYIKDVTILQGDVSKATKDIYLYAARNNFFDYNMCHTLAYYIINNNQNIKKLISKTYKYIFLDEFQDMNVRHYDILKCLFNNQYNKICAVGDFNQAIMGWAGAVPDIFNKFQNDFSSTQHLFTYNHRSTPTIVEFINKVICKLTPSGQQIIKYSCSKTSQVTNSFIAAYGAYTVEDEATYIACCIKTILAENINLHPNDIAIILKQKTSDYLSTTSQIFTQYSICVRNEDEKVCKNGLRFQDLMVDSFSKLIIYLLKSKLKIITITEQKELFSLLADILSLDIGRNNNIKKIHNKINEIHEIDFDNIQEWLHSCVEARRIAIDLAKDVMAGKDPQAEKEDARKSETMADFWKIFDERYSCLKEKSKNYRRSNLSIWKNIIAPDLAHKRIKNITTNDIYYCYRKETIAVLHFFPHKQSDTEKHIFSYHWE